MTWTCARVAAAVALGLLAAPLTTEAQPPGKVHRIGFLSSGATAPAPVLEGFRHGLRERGWIEGGHQREDGQGTRVDDSAGAVAASRKDHRVMDGGPP